MKNVIEMRHSSYKDTHSVSFIYFTTGLFFPFIPFLLEYVCQEVSLCLPVKLFNTKHIC